MSLLTLFLHLTLVVEREKIEYKVRELKLHIMNTFHNIEFLRISVHYDYHGKYEESFAILINNGNHNRVFICFNFFLMFFFSNYDFCVKKQKLLYDFI